MKRFCICALNVGLTSWIFVAIALCPAVMAQSHQPMLAQTFDDQMINGWWMSEKLDGVRGYWDGQRLYSKNGHLFAAPAEFTATFPPFPVEGELWAGRNSFEQTASVVQRDTPHGGWMALKFGVFDVPAATGSFRQRLTEIKAWLRQNPSPIAFVVTQTPIQDLDHLAAERIRIEELGGEGLIVRDPDAPYEAGRSMAILKVKSYQDAEAVVIAHLPGKGKHEGRLGALLVQSEDGRCFRLGTGFSDAERISPPVIGSIITYKFYGLYQSGLPKFASFLRIRQDSGL